MKVIAHRGANKVAPQNTVPAFRKAVEMGADGFENDVHLTKDDFIVVCHNYDIDDTSNGTGKIADMTLEELYKYDFGSYFSEEFAGTKIPRLEEFLELCKGLSVINIEIKKPEQKNSPIVEKTIKMVKDYGLFDNLIISSFEAEILRECKEIDPKTKTGMLYSPDDDYCERICDDPIAFAKEYGFDAYHPYFLMVNEDYIEECHDNGLIVNPWTVNKDYSIEHLLDWGCDGVITDVPDLALEIVNRK